MAVTVELLVFESVDLLDLGGPYEVLLTANRLAQREGRPAPFDVRTVAVDGGVHAAYGGLGLAAADAVAEHGAPDVFLVPGTMDIPGVTADSELMQFITDRSQRAAMTASVCTGSVLLAHAGALGDVVATTHHEDVPVLAGLIGEERAVTARWVDAGDVVTAGGLSSGIAMALHLVERYVSRDLAVRTARQIAYDWDPEEGLAVSAEGD